MGKDVNYSNTQSHRQHWGHNESLRNSSHFSGVHRTNVCGGENQHRKKGDQGQAWARGRRLVAIGSTGVKIFFAVLGCLGMPALLRTRQMVDSPSGASIGGFAGCMEVALVVSGRPKAHANLVLPAPVVL